MNTTLRTGLRGSSKLGLIVTATLPEVVEILDRRWAWRPKYELGIWNRKHAGEEPLRSKPIAVLTFECGGV